MTSLAALLWMLSVRATAAEGDGGLPGAFLSLGAGARPLGMAGAHVAVADDAGAIVWNPARLSALERGAATAGDHLLVAGAGHLVGAVAWPTLRYGTAAAAFAYLRGGDAVLRDARGDVLGSAAGTQLALSLGYGIDSGGASIGAAVHALRHSFGADVQSGIEASAGASLDLRRVSPALAGLEFGLRVAGVPAGRIGSSASVAAARAGASYRPTSLPVLVAADVEGFSGRDLRYAAGAEYVAFRRLALRAGWNGAPAFGVGFRYESFAGDYALAPGPIGLLHRASLSVSFGPDLAAPRIRVETPVFDANGIAAVSTDKVTLAIVVESREPLRRVRIAGKEMRVPDPRRFALSQVVGVKDGKNPFRVDVETAGGRTATAPLVILADTRPPEIEILEPRPGAKTVRDQVPVRAVVRDASDVMAVSVNDLPVLLSPGDRVEVQQSAAVPWSGKNAIRIAATDRFGHTRVADVEVVREGGPPAPADRATKQSDVDERTARQALAKGTEYAGVGRYDLAVAELRYALKLMPALAEAQTLLSRAEAELARAPSRPAATAGPESAELAELRRAVEDHFARGKQLFDLGQYKRALLELKLVLELARMHAQAADLIARCRAKLDEYVTARVGDARAAHAKGQLAREISLLKDALAQDETNSVALSMLKEARARVPSEKRRLHIKALDLYGRDLVDEAVSVWREARELDPDDEQIRRALDKAEQKLIEQKKGALGK